MFYAIFIKHDFNPTYFVKQMGFSTKSTRQAHEKPDVHNINHLFSYSSCHDYPEQSVFSTLQIYEFRHTDYIRKGGFSAKAMSKRLHILLFMQIVLDC